MSRGCRSFIVVSRGGSDIDVRSLKASGRVTGKTSIKDDHVMLSNVPERPLW